MATEDELKKAAAERAVQLVRPGMVVGLGTGTTTRHFIAGVGRLVADGMQLTAVPTSRASETQARALGISLVDELDREIDLTVDGADEIDAELRLIKGRGGALFREKLVAEASQQFVVVAEESKLVDRLGAGAPPVALPVEVLPFLWRRTADRLAGLGARWVLRGAEDAPYLTDNGNVVLDCTFDGGIPDPEGLGRELKLITGVVEHGLFAGLTSAAIVAGPGGVRVLGSI
ncbi:MAG TPA: ribose-5-phosphate isomerase RpiA [Candidatus Dormibacteraeota bacterium]